VGRARSPHELVRQIGTTHVSRAPPLRTLQLQAAHSGIERREQLVGDISTSARQRVDNVDLPALV